MPSFYAAPLALIALLASSASAQFTINTPMNVVVCLPELLAWTGGTPPYFLSILPAGQPSAAALVDLGEQTGDSVTWVANLPVGTGAFLDLRDNTGTLAQSGTFTIQTGSNTTCVGQTAVTSAGPTTAGGSTTAAGGAATSANSGSGSTPSTQGSASSTAKTTATTSKAASAAALQYAPVGAAAMIGAALLAMIA